MPPPPAVRVRDLDHYVIVTGDVERLLTFYCDVLGLEPVRVDAWRRGEVLFPSVRIGDGPLVDFLAGERTGVNVDHVALVVDPDTDLDALAASGTLDVVAGPADLFGARGQGRGLYVRDPDGNTVELRTYPPVTDAAPARDQARAGSPPGSGRVP